MSQIDNERTKLFAGALDRASTACFTVWVATPLAGYLYGVLSFSAATSSYWLGFTAAAWLFATVAPHLWARRILTGLKA